MWTGRLEDAMAQPLLTLHRAEGPRRGRGWPRKVDTFDPPLRESKVGVRKIKLRPLTHVTFPRGGKLGISRAEFVKPLVSPTENRTQNGFF